MIEEIIKKAKQENKKIYIFAHKFPDGDAIASSCALAEYFKSKGIDSKYVITTPGVSYPKFIREVPTTHAIDKNNISILLDTNTLAYAENRLFLNSLPQDTYVIDHHMKDEARGCIENHLKLSKQNVSRNPDASSTCEMLACEIGKENLTPEIASLLLLGLMTDTAKLKFLKPNTLENVSMLIEAGADYDAVISKTTRKSNLKSEVALSSIFLNAQKFEIGDTFGLILPIDYKTVSRMESNHRLRNLQKKVFKMSDIENCSFTCMFAETSSGEFELEFRSTPIYGNFNVQQMATMYGGRSDITMLLVVI